LVLVGFPKKLAFKSALEELQHCIQEVFRAVKLTGTGCEKDIACFDFIVLVRKAFITATCMHMYKKSGVCVVMLVA